MRVLHVFKRAYADPKHRYLGSVKDIRSRTEYFKTCGHSCEELLVSSRNRFAEELKKVSANQWDTYDAVCLEMTDSPAALHIVRALATRAVLLVRSHNAELLHRYHWARAQGFHPSSLNFLIQAIKNCRLDRLSGQRCDRILSIDCWETKIYWQRLLRVEKSVWLPFFLPEAYLSELTPNGTKQKICVHFGASMDNPLIADATANFIRMVERTASRLQDWQFYATGSTASKNHCESKHIHWTGLLDRPYDALHQAKAMALLSPYGFGFKTKILEAIMARAFVILPRELYRRLPEPLLKFCIPIDHRSESDFEGALRKCDRPFPDGNPNAEFRRIAFEQMDSILMQSRYNP